MAAAKVEADRKAGMMDKVVQKIEEEHVAQEEAVREQLVSRATFAHWPPCSLILLLVPLRQEVRVALLCRVVVPGGHGRGWA